MLSNDNDQEFITEDLINVFMEIASTVQNEENFWFQIMLAVHRNNKTKIDSPELSKLVMEVITKDQENPDMSPVEQIDYASANKVLLWTVDDATCG